MASDAEIRDRLERIFKFLADYSWIYEERNVDIFVRNVLEKIPLEWVTCLNSLDFSDLQKIPLGFYKEDWPCELKQFLKEANDIGKSRYSWRLPHECTFTAEDIEVPKFITQSTPAKKLNEIKCMSAVVGHFALKYNCGTVLDVGSGLGYLDQVMHHNFNLVTIGVESIKERSLEALSRIKKGVCSKNMHHVQCNISNTDECEKQLRNILSSVINIDDCECGKHKSSWDQKLRKNVMMVGLHCCGNFMQDMMKLFCQIPTLTVFLTAGCCYHKTPPEEFPLSNCAKTVVSTLKNYWTPCVTGLRLGCQMTRSNWCIMTEEKYSQQQKCLFYRALLQHFLQKENLEWKKPKRHLQKSKDMLSIESFLSVTFQNYDWSDTRKQACTSKFLEIAKTKEHLYFHIKVLDVLQILLQPIWEMAVLTDQVTFFKENGILTNIYRMCDELISPRSLLLFGMKNHSMNAKTECALCI